MASDVTVTLHNAAINRFLKERDGPVGAHMGKIAQKVADQAYQNASGHFIDVDQGYLRDGAGRFSGIQADVVEGLNGPMGVVESDAQSLDKDGRPTGFSYPAYHDQTLRPWLSEALRKVMRELA